MLITAPDATLTDPPESRRSWNWPPPAVPPSTFSVPAQFVW
jgi:hypothetical protein